MASVATILVTSQIDDAEVRSPYPRFKDRALHEIASTTGGLIYLDWLVGWMEEQKIASEFRKSLTRFLARPEISRAVDLAIEHRSSGKSDDVPGAWHPPGLNKKFWEK